MLRELYDDFKRYLRDKEVNGQKYIKVTAKGALICLLLCTSYDVHVLVVSFTSYLHVHIMHVVVSIIHVHVLIIVHVHVCVGRVPVSSANIRVSDVVLVHKV